MQLRDYQTGAIAQIYKFYKSGITSVLLYAPTGAGKTVIAAKVIADAVARGRGVLFLCHRVKLIQQTAQTLYRSYGIHSGIIWADHPPDYTLPVQLAMVQTIQNRQLPPDIGLVIGDECHTLSYYSIWSKIQQHYSGGVVALSKCYFLGLTASPWRTEKDEGFCQFFQAVAKAPFPEELIERGFLVKARHFGYEKMIDFSKLKIKNGEFTESSIQLVCGEDLNIKIVAKFLEFCPKRKAIAFCAGVFAANNLAVHFNRAGISAQTITGETPEEERRLIYERFKDGRTQILCSVAVLTEGFDEPSCDGVILARPTKSVALLVQMCGRALRIFEGKEDAVLLDFCENFKRLDVPIKQRRIPLCPSKKQDKIGTKICPKCAAVVSFFKIKCPECGYQFEEQYEGRGNLKEDKYEPDESSWREFLTPLQNEQLQYLHQQIRLAYSKNRDLGAASLNFFKRYNFVPPLEWYRNAIFQRKKRTAKQLERDRATLIKYLRRVIPQASSKFVEVYLIREFGITKCPCD